MSSTLHASTDHESMVHIERLFDAPRDDVFAAWTNPEMLPKWFAPSGCRVDFHELAVVEGGRFHSCITTPDEKECWCIGEYLEVTAPRRIVFTMAVADADGNRIGANEAGMDPEWPRETIVTVTFEEVGEKTKLTLQQSVREALAKRTGAHPSWLSMFDRLEQLLGSGGGR